MPRESITINRYDRGLADDPSPKNLKVGELKEAVNIQVAADGRVSMLGKFTSDTSLSSGPVSDIKTVEPGYGLFTFSSDYTSTGGLQRTDYFAVAGKSSNNQRKSVQVIESDGTSFTTIHLTTNDTTTFQPTFYYIDGALRISDGNLDSTKPVSKWLGYVDSLHFTDSTGNATVYSSWHSANQEISAPTHGLAGQIVNGVAEGTSNSTLLTVSLSGTVDITYDDYSTQITDHFVGGFNNQTIAPILSQPSSLTLGTSSISTETWSGNPFTIFPPAGAGINIKIVPKGSSEFVDAAMSSGTYFHAVSFVYDKSSQESRLYEFLGRTILSSTVGTAPYGMAVSVYAQEPFNPRIRKMRVYSALNSQANITSFSSSKGIDEWYHTFDIDMDKGGVVSEKVEEYEGWNSNAYTANSTATAATNKYISFTVSVLGLSGDTYDSLSGNNFNDSQLSAVYKSVAISNRTAYIGGVRVGDNRYPDSMFKSLPNKFDNFGESLRLDVARQDGENVVTLEAYADRVLQFKERTLYIINTAQDIEFLEAQMDNLGVSSPRQVIRTEYGIMWFNNRGCYLYDGNQVRDLFLDPNDFSRRVVKLNSWRSFIGNSPQIGYDALEKKAFIWADRSNNSSSVSVRVFDFSTLGWSKMEGGIDNFSAGQNYTNIITDLDGVARVYTEAGTKEEFMTWQPDTTMHSSTLSIETGEYDFNSPGESKNLYVVYVNHKNAGTGISVSYRVDGTSTLNALVTTAGASVLPNATSFTNTRLKPTNTSAGRNLKSISIVVSGSGDSVVPENFEMKDIEVIARRKGLR